MGFAADNNAFSRFVEMPNEGSSGGKLPLPTLTLCRVNNANFTLIDDGEHASSSSSSSSSPGHLLSSAYTYSNKKELADFLTTAVIIGTSTVCCMGGGSEKSGKAGKGFWKLGGFRKGRGVFPWAAFGGNSFLIIFKRVASFPFPIP